jgi:hypothetical protein
MKNRGDATTPCPVIKKWPWGVGADGQQPLSLVNTVLPQDQMLEKRHPSWHLRGTSQLFFSKAKNKGVSTNFFL